MTYNVFSGTLNLTQSINLLSESSLGLCPFIPSFVFCRLRNDLSVELNRKPHLLNSTQFFLPDVPFAACLCSVNTSETLII